MMIEVELVGVVETKKNKHFFFDKACHPGSGGTSLENKIKSTTIESSMAEKIGGEFSC